eukprot:6197536-Pleurochrysis_carterae.AAC.7
MIARARARWRRHRASERASSSHPPIISVRGVSTWGGGPGGTGREGTEDRRAGATPRVGAGGASGPPTQSATRPVVSGLPRHSGGSKLTKGR